VALGSLLPGVAGAAGPSPQAQRAAAQLTGAASAIAAASATVDRLRARPASPIAIDQLRADLELEQAAFVFRDAVRREQELVYALAGRPDLESATLRLLPGPRAAAIASVDQGLRALWLMAGIDPGTPVHPRHSRDFADSETVDSLLAYYRSAAARTGIDWTYLAAINFIESDFGRTNGPSSAGALGPMQFLPDTFREYGGGGDIMSPHDSILAAAVMLARNGAPADYDRAVLRYNHSQEYVAAVKAYAAAVRSDPGWLTRFYYWGTYG
jgi:membrane-bound lytic murein transglycosylase B